jgi:hypothetical protein
MPFNVPFILGALAVTAVSADYLDHGILFGFGL